MKKVIERGKEAERVASSIRRLSLVIVPFDEQLAMTSAELYPQAKPHGLSFADRACLALGIQRKCKVLTSERRWQLLDLPIKVKVIRNAH